MPQAVAAAISWVGSTIGAWAGTTAISAGVQAGTAAFLANAAAAAAEIALYAGIAHGVDAAMRPELPKPQGGELAIQIDPDFPRQMIIGERAVAGSLVARYSRGPSLYNAHLVLQLADHPCTALTKVYGDGRLVRDAPLTHGVRTEITAYSNSGGARVWITWHDGRPGQAADADLVAKSAQDPDVVAGKFPAWSSACTGAGCAYVHVEVQFDSDILTSIPNFLFLVQGAKLYDRRKDTTAGGSGAHRLDDPSTWEYSTNARVALDHYLLGYQVEDDPLAFGIGLLPSEIPYDDFAAGADLCDEDVETGTGEAIATLKRYAVNAVIGADEYFEPVLDAFQLQMAARIVDLGGRIGVLGAEERATVVSLTDGDLVSEASIQFADKLPFSSLVGAVQSSYADPANLWQQTPIAPIRSAYAALPDGGEATTEQIDLPYEINPRRAARLASAWIARESLQPRLVAQFMPKAWTLEVGDWFEFSSNLLQIEAAKFEVVDIIKHPDFTVTLTARAIDPNFLAFDNDNDPDLSVPPNVAPALIALDVPEFSVAATTIAGGGAEEPALVFTLAEIDPLARELIIEARQWDGAAFTGSSLFEVSHADQDTTLLRRGILPATLYKVRAKCRAGRKESAWSDWSEAVETSGTYIVPQVPWNGVIDKPDPVVALQETVDRLSELILSTQARIDETRAFLGKLGRIDGVPAGTAIERVKTQALTATQAVASEVSLIASRLNGAEASIVEVRETSASASAANASSILALQGKVAGLEQGSSGTANALQLLAVRVSRNEGLITVNASAITQVQASLASAQNALLAHASVMDALDAHITSAEGRITSQSARISAVEASVGGVSSSVSQVALALANSDNRVSAYYALKGVAGSSEFEFSAMAEGGGIPSQITLRASQIRLHGDVVINGTLTTNKVADRAINEITVSEIATPTNLNSTAAYQTQDAIVFVKATANGVVRIKAQGMIVLPSGSPVQIDMRVKRNGVQVGFKHGFYNVAFGTYAAEWIVQGVPTGASTYTLEINANRSGAGATGVRCDASIFEVSEVKK